MVTVNNSGKIVPSCLNELKELVEDENVHLGDIDVRNITSFNYLFKSSKRKYYSGLEKWDVSHVTDMSSMFFMNNHFKGFEIENWDVSNVTNMGGIFYACKRFKDDLSKWNV